MLDGNGGRAFKSRLMPENEEKSRDRRTAAPKKPADQGTRGPKAKSAEKEARLAEALRANLKRRKAPGADRAEDEKEA